MAEMNVNANATNVMGEEGFAMLGGNEMNMGEGAMESMTTLNPASVEGGKRRRRRSSRKSRKARKSRKGRKGRKVRKTQRKTNKNNSRRNKKNSRRNHHNN